MSTARWKGYGLLALVFLLGGLTGGGVALALTRERAVRALEGHPRGRGQAPLLRELDRELALTPGQRARIGELLRAAQKDRREAMRRVLSECGEPLRERQRALAAEIRVLLTPEQQPRFDELAAERERRFFEGEPPHPEGH